MKNTFNRTRPQAVSCHDTKLSLANNVGSAVKLGNDLTLFLVKSDKGGTQVLDPGSDYMVMIIHQSVCFSVCIMYFN